MWPNSQFPADLATFTEEILSGKLHFLCSDKFPILVREGLHDPVETMSVISNMGESKEHLQKILHALVIIKAIQTS